MCALLKFGLAATPAHVAPQMIGRAPQSQQ